MTGASETPRDRIRELVPYFLRLGLLDSGARLRWSAKWSANWWMSAAG